MKTPLEIKQMTIPQLTEELRAADAHVQEHRAYMRLVHDELETKEVVAHTVAKLQHLNGPQRERLLMEIAPGIDESAVGKP